VSFIDSLLTSGFLLNRFDILDILSLSLTRIALSGLTQT